MSERETVSASQLIDIQGINQRLSPTLAPNNYCSISKNVLFSTQGDIERVPGKVLISEFDSPVINLYQFGRILIVQTFGGISTVPIDDLDEAIRDETGDPITDETDDIIYDEI